MTKLSGKVAIIRDGQVREVRDLGPIPIEVRAGVCKPLVEDIPELQEGEQLVGPTYEVSVDDVLASYTKKDAATVAEEDKEAQLSAVQTVIFKALFSHENRIRTLEGKAAITAAQFRDALKAAL